MPICPQCKKENPELGAKCPRCSDSYYVYDDAVEDAERDPYIGQKAGDKYVIIGRISEGGMGTVYRALQLPVEREVAFKVLRAELEDNDEVRNRFTREARAVSKINHPNIITLHDFGFDASDYPYMVMEYAPGRSLDDWIYNQRISLGRVVHVLRQILSALADAHAHGVIHRDLKPENIMVTGTGTDEDFIKLLDFGIARLVNEQMTESLTREGEVFGTPHYMSPEQAEGETGIGPPADVYALGIMLYEMLCAECPFDAPKPLSILFKQINEELPPLNPRPEVAVPRALENLLRKATAKDPAARYRTAGEMLDALDRIDDPERSGIVEVANGTTGETQRGIGEQTAPLGDARATRQQDRQRDSRPSQQQVATANTLGFEDTDDGTNPPTAPQGRSRDTGAGTSNDVAVDEPTDSLFGIEDTHGGNQRAIIAMIAVLAVIFIGGFSALLMLGGDGESAAATDGSKASGEAGSETVAANDEGTDDPPREDPTVADGPDAGSGGDASARAAAGNDTGTESGARAEGKTGEGTSESSPAGGSERAERDETVESTSDPSGGSGSTTAESGTGGGSAPSGGGRGGESSPDPTPTPDFDPDPSSDSSSDDEETKIEKFGAPTQSNDEESDEPTKFGAPEKFGPPE